jgi:hypothetical protein
MPIWLTRYWPARYGVTGGSPTPFWPWQAVHGRTCRAVSPVVASAAPRVTRSGALAGGGTVVACTVAEYGAAASISSSVRALAIGVMIAFRRVPEAKSRSCLLRESAC